MIQWWGMVQWWRMIQWWRIQWWVLFEDFRLFLKSTGERVVAGRNGGIFRNVAWELADETRVTRLADEARVTCFPGGRQGLARRDGGKGEGLSLNTVMPGISNSPSQSLFYHVYTSAPLMRTHQSEFYCR